MVLPHLERQFRLPSLRSNRYDTESETSLDANAELYVVIKLIAEISFVVPSRRPPQAWYN